MNKKFVFLFLIISSFFVSNIDVFAVELWGYNVQSPTNFNYYLSHSGGSNSMTTGYNSDKTIAAQYTPQLTNATIGIQDVSFSLQANHNYTYNLYWCYSSTSTLNFNTILFYVYDYQNSSSEIVSIGTNNASSIPYMQNMTPYDYTSCAISTINFNQNSTLNWTDIMTEIQFNSSVKKSITIFGSSLTDNGLSTSYFDDLLGPFSLTDIINNQNSNKQEIINNQNSNTQQQISNENKNHDETMNADAESSFKGDGGSVDNYNQAESDLMDSIDVDLDGIGLDLSNYTKPFSWIWQQVDRLLNLNPKVFGCVIAVLTFGFIGLVINR